MRATECFMLGALIGAAAALLLAPQSGEKTRKDIKKFASKAKEDIGKRVGEVKEKAKKIVGKIKEK